ncbi:MAG: hypothetical protein ACI4BB_12160 [Coprococcus sp.]
MMKLKMMNSRFMLIASMVIFGTLGPFVRNIAVSSGELALYRAILATLLISVTILGETMTAWQVTGGMLILGFTLWNEISRGTG